MAIIESAIKARLDGTAALTALLDTQTSIFAVLAPQSASVPFIVFKVLTEDPTNAMGGETNPVEARFAVDVFANSFLEVVNISEQVRATFKRLRGTVGGVVIQDTFYEGRNDIYSENDGDYHRSLDFSIYFED
jgi:hypothetical protein